MNTDNLRYVPPLLPRIPAGRCDLPFDAGHTQVTDGTTSSNGEGCPETMSVFELDQAIELSEGDTYLTVVMPSDGQQ